MRPAHSAREIVSQSRRRRPVCVGFNEARAFSAGNLVGFRSYAKNPQASMRPAHSAREIRHRSVFPISFHAASMRPAHSAREIVSTPESEEACLLASMRPAHSAREIVPVDPIFPFEPFASMRPAHSAREIDDFVRRLNDEPNGFNEARAFSAGNLRMRFWRSAFRKASMRPAHSAREIAQAGAARILPEFASMRPAHSAREIGLR